MKNRFEDVRMWMWRYDRDSRYRDEVHCMATPESWDVLMRAIEELPEERQRTFPLRQLRVEHDPTGFSDSFAWFSKLRVGLTREDPELFQMNVSTAEEAVIVMLHPDFVSEFLKSLQSVREGGWDFGFGTEKRKKSNHAFGARDRASLTLFFWQPMRGTT